MKKTTAIPPPPSGLSDPAAALWRDVLSQFELEPHIAELLKCACQQLTVAHQARERLLTDGLVVVDRWQQTKPHPCVEIERSAMLAAMRLLRETGLSIELPETRAPRAVGRTGSRR